MSAAATSLWWVLACAAAPPAPAWTASLQRSGLPLKSFGVYAEPVDGNAPEALAALNTEQPFLLASTAKLVTSLAAIDLLGLDHRWRSQAFATAPPGNGRLVGDLVIVGSDAGITPADLRRWFKAMHAQGLTEVSGRIVLRRFALLHESDPAQAAASAEEAAPGATPEARDFLRGALVVSVQPSAGERAAVSVTPQPLGMQVINEVLMGGGVCNAWPQWRSAQETGAMPQLLVRGRWDKSCGRERIAYVRPPPSLRLAPMVNAAVAPKPRVPTASMVAALWAETGGKLRGRVVESEAPSVARRLMRTVAVDDELAPAWSSEFSTALPELLREMNKTSNNIAARRLLLSLGQGPAAHARDPLRSAQDRMQGWLRGQGVADAELHIDIGSGQSRSERGTPRALVQLLHNAWRTSGSQAFVNSLPIAGVDGTLAHRMRTGSATGQAYLKTGTLSDTRALAGYVRAKSGRVYAVAALANHAQAARATPALDAFIEWVAQNG